MSFTDGRTGWDIKEKDSVADIRSRPGIFVADDRMTCDRLGISCFFASSERRTRQSCVYDQNCASICRIYEYQGGCCVEWYKELTNSEHGG